MGKSHDPRMHSAEHILNGVMVKTFGCERCFSAHINPKKSKCDYRFERALADNEAADIERAVNEQLARNLDVSEETISREEAEDRYNLMRLPQGVDSVRIVKVGDFDACPCIGEHVKNTAEIGRFVLGSHDFKDGVLRLRFKLTAPC
ncbi:hypothetical protein [Pseudodesulfovibrio senegalensis]|uniref:Threonyl/alanyl tRNA synthetase SAD domain-containing protein n=1 Tax=Pseudodesulfovibrio senegalensis TaxID=1721087 RepID=A0A6N6N9D0_9BACT|nr:hypothetical protein [Pseudodesulfovibrio senegalensis]KAB1443739.1 hypothetical protein F8A88_05750 [Pseudodesulfovibrio senegalensis]